MSGTAYETVQIWESVKVREIQGKRKLRQIIPADAEQTVLSRYLRKQLGFTKAQISSMKFRENGILVNGKRARINTVLQSGDVLELLLERETESAGHVVPVHIPLQILYEDEDVIAVWKEAGLVVHPAHGHYSDTLSNRVRGYCQEKGMEMTVRSIGRLDKDTSGIVIFAKNQTAAARLWQQKENGSFRKEYLAVCECSCGQENSSWISRWHTIDTPIGKIEGELMKMCISSTGRPAVTHYRLMSRTEAAAFMKEHGVSLLLPEKLSLAQVHIETGRTHQIRVHMASVGYPLAGDPLYGNGAEGQTETKLCAWKAELLQPFTGQRIQIEKIPENFSV